MPDSYKTLSLLDSSKLKKIHLFSDLNENEIDSLKAICTLKNFSKGEMIFFDTEPYRGFYCVSKGKIRIYKISKDGKEHTLHFVDEKNTFAEVPMFENYGSETAKELTYPANAIALEAGTQLIFIPMKNFFKIFEQNSGICLKMIASLSRRLRVLNNHIESLTLQDVSKRIANYILTEVKNQSNNISDSVKSVKVDILRADLASYLGIAVETLSRTLKKFQDDGLIEVKGRMILISNFKSLTEIANQ